MNGGSTDVDADADGVKPVPGRVIAGRYRLDRPIASGGMGSVWAGMHMVTRRPVALKFLHPAGVSAESRARFLQEARAACAVIHPNVVQVLDFLTVDDDAPAMVLELLDGESLRRRLDREGRLTVGATLDVLAPVVSAVGTAHAAGIVHRDLKPENIFLQHDGHERPTVKVLDFGVAKVMARGEAPDDDVAVPTHAGTLLGTPAYMAPEQAFGELDVDHRADVWALGLIFYECLTGVRPTAGANAGQTFKRIVSQPVPPVRGLVPDLPPTLAALIDAMLQRDREDRPPDLRPVLEGLHTLGAPSVPAFGAPRSATQRPPTSPAAPGSATPPPDDATRPLTCDRPRPEASLPPGPPPGTRGAHRWGVLLGLGLSVIAALVWLAMPQTPPADERVPETAIKRLDPPAPAPSQAPGPDTATAAAPTAASPAAAPTAVAEARPATSAPPPARPSRRPAPPPRIAGPGSAPAPHPDDPYGF